MSEQADPAQRVAIGISFGNSYSSIAFTTGVSNSMMIEYIRYIDIVQDGKAQVIANEDGGPQPAPRATLTIFAC